MPELNNEYLKENMRLSCNLRSALSIGASIRAISGRSRNLHVCNICNIYNSIRRGFTSSDSSKDVINSRLLKRPWQQETKSGLKYRDDNSEGVIPQKDQQGGSVEGAAGAAGAAVGDQVSVHYTGYLPNSQMKVFDSSLPRGKPISFTLGDNKVIAGWEEGILGMRVGGRRQMLIPPHLGYGYNDMGSIPAGSFLLFDCELLGISKHRSLADKIKSFFKSSS